ncbi:MAG TPA: tetratricopeptide repeat protein [Candidatus Acidoferrum sp.]|nr:tetratricopeptide repeat protein [Candidatus Acidoferrum sp.]
MRVKRCARLSFARWLLPIIPFVMLVCPACCQDSGSAERESYGNGSEITVTVHDVSGEPIATAAMVKLYRDGTILSRQGETSRGSAVLVVNGLGEFSVIVEAAGYESAQKDVSVQITGRTQVDVYLKRMSAAGNTAEVPERPVLAPKAKESLNKGLQALSADKLREAEKYVGETMRLAPGNPDVLYAQGVLSLKQRNWARAQEALEKATQIDPKHARAFAALGMALCDRGKYGAAIAPLEKSLQLDAVGTWETRWTLAKAYYQDARYGEALKMSQEALAASNGKAPEIALLVAQSLTAVGRYEDAAQMLREFLREHGDRREAGTARRWLQGLGANGKIRTN